MLACDLDFSQGNGSKRTTLEFASVLDAYQPSTLNHGKSHGNQVSSALGANMHCLKLLFITNKVINKFQRYASSAVPCKSTFPKIFY